MKAKHFLWALFLWLALAPTVSAFYDPSTGRWLNRDPIGEANAINLFQCVYNDTINSIDVFGLCGKRPSPCSVLLQSHQTQCIHLKKTQKNLYAAILARKKYIQDHLASNPKFKCSEDPECARLQKYAAGFDAIEGNEFSQIQELEVLLEDSKCKFTSCITAGVPFPYSRITN